MEIVLISNVKNLGTIGSVVKVKDGYGRNYLIPQKKAVRATAQNLKIVEEKKAQLLENNRKNLKEARDIAKSLDGISISIIRSASESGHLYGSIRSQDIALSLVEKGFAIKKEHIQIPTPIKTIGLHKIFINLHSDVESSIIVSVAQSEEEASLQIDN